MAIVRVLGAIEVRSTDPTAAVAVTDHALASARLRRLLCALTIRAGETISIDQLADAVWGDGQPDNPTTALHNLVFRLRSDLRRRGAEAVEIRTLPPGYRLVADESAIDVRLFMDGVRAGCAELDVDPTSALRRLDECEGLWRGRPFGELADESWLQPSIAHLDELHQMGVEAAADALLRLGRPAEAVDRLLPWTISHPFTESLHVRHMRALAAANRPGEALEVYQALRARLAEELGTDPTPETQRVHQQILRQRETVVKPAQPGLIGRADELAAVRELTARHRVVTLVGVGGVGKTALAVALNPGWVAELAAVAQPDSVVHCVAEATGARLRRDKPPVEALAAALADASGVLVLDNCEHLIDAAAQVAATIVRRCPRLKVLATSQVPLRIGEEAVFEVKPLASPEPGDRDPDSVASAPAVQLLVARVRARDPAFTVTAGNSAAVAEVCRRLDGVPLGVELAATRMHALSPEALADRLQWRFRVLRGGRTTDPRHRSLHALVDWSYSLLDSQVQPLFDALSVYPTSFDLTSAEELVHELGGTPDDAVAGISELVDASMLTADGGRYRMLETLRDFGRERLEASGTRTEVFRAHARHVASRIAGLERQLWGKGHHTAAALVAGAFDDVRQAVEWARHHDLGLAGELLAGCLPCLELTMSTEITAWARDLVADLERSGDFEQLPSAARLIAACGARFDGDLPAARRWAESVLGRPTTDPILVHAEMILGEVAMFQGDMPSSRSHGESMKAAADRAGMRGAVHLAEGSLILVDAYDLPSDRRKELAGNAAHLADEAAAAGERVTEFWCHYITGECLLEQYPDRSAGLLDIAIDGGRGTGDRYLEGVAMVSRASIEARSGDPRRAAAMFLATARHWWEAGNWTHQWVSLRSICELLATTGDAVAAARLLGAVLAADGHTGTGIQGEDAARLARVARGLASRLGETELGRLKAVGSVMDRDDVVRATMAALTTLADGAAGVREH